MAPPRSRSDDPRGFISVANIQVCESRFRSYMLDKYNIVIAENDMTIRRRLYNVMAELNDMHGKDQTWSIKDLNNLAMNITKELMLREGGHPHAPHPHQQPEQHQQQHQQLLLQEPREQTPVRIAPLERERDVFGERSVPYRDMTPVDVGGGDRRGAVDDLNRAFERLREEREPPGAPIGLPPWISNGGAPSEGAKKEGAKNEGARSEGAGGVAMWNDVQVSTTAMDADEFSRRIRELQEQREDAASHLVPPPPQSDDRAAIIRSALQHADEFQRSNAIANHDGVVARPARKLPNPFDAPPVPRRSGTVERFIAINGFDRNLTVCPKRYSYTVSTAGTDTGLLMGNYKNVEWIAATGIILPMEIVQSNNNNIATPRLFFNHEFSFAYPYVTLTLDGFDNVYDGTNDSLRRAFAVFIYHRSYKAPNGRGYVLLTPAQNERKTFATPIASLRDITVSLFKPNGTLINNSVDDTTSSMIIYDPQYRQYVRIMCDIYFDRNEYYPGDMIMITGYRVTTPPDGDAAAFAGLHDFVNRRQGHEIVMLGPPNAQGFYNSFYVLAPGVLDQQAGRVILDERLLVAIGQLPSAPVAARGRVINMSLQNVITLTIGVSNVDINRVLPPPQTVP